VTAERQYRRILWAYPRSYRRRHGAEIVTTLLDIAEDGRGRPGVGPALHLIAWGIRQRFRLPAGRPLAWAAALLTAVALGAAGSAGGAWLGWQTAAGVPSETEARSLAGAISGGGGAAVYPWRSAMGGPVVGTVTYGTSTWSSERIRSALAADGWRLTEYVEDGTRGVVVHPTAPDQQVVPMRMARFRAVKDGLHLQGDTSVVIGGAGYGVDGDLSQRFDAWAVPPRVVRPLAVAGLLAGALAGWLLAASVAYRVRRNPAGVRRAATGLGVLALAGSVVPAYRLGHWVYEVMVYDTGNPDPYVVDVPTMPMAAVLLRTGIGVALVSFAALMLLTGVAGRHGVAAEQPIGPA